jgi:hypothetical protein
MAKLIRTTEGAFFQETPSGLAAINDPRTLQQLYRGELPYENQAFGGTASPQVTSPNLIKQPNATIPNPGEVNQDPLVGGANPIEKFNLALLDMMKKAQEGQRGMQVQKDDASRAGQQAVRQTFTGDEAMLTPDAMYNEAANRGKMYNPTIDAATTKIKQYQDIMDLMKKTYGEDMSAMLPATEEDAAVYKQALRAGMTIPADILKKYGKFFTADDWAAWSYQTKKGESGKSDEDKEREERDKAAEKYANELADKLQSVREGSKMTREDAVRMFKARFPEYDGNVIYDLVPDNYKKY